MTRRSIGEYAESMRRRYFVARKPERTRLLNEFCQTTNYHRKSAIRLLRRRGRPTPDRRGRQRQYGRGVAEALQRLWEISDRLCSKRLAPMLATLVDALERHGELVLDEAVRAQVLHLSPATIDRVLRPVRTRGQRRPYSQGPAETTLKAQIPIRTFGEWVDVTPGAVQADLVMHCGESTDGFYLATLDVVDVATGWTECEIVWGKAYERVGTAVHHVRQRLPFALRELHTDNGSEFLNTLLYPWCKQEKIAFTRGRPYKKNDQAYVEQKNWSVVRRIIGYQRFSTKAAEAVFARLYAVLRLYLNFFQPIRKLVSKERQGAKVVKRYDVAQTPYQRLLASGRLSETGRQTLARDFTRLNPRRLRDDIDHLLETLWALAARPNHPTPTMVTGSGRPPQGDAGQLSTSPQRDKKERSKERKEKEATTTPANG